MKHIAYSTEARRKIKAGIDKVADAVKITLGPKGRNVIFDKPYADPVITNDGVSIAKEIELTDHFENLGAKLIKQVAEKTNNKAGDGTTTATVLAQALCHEGLRLVETGVNPIGIRHGMEAAKDDVIDVLKKNAKVLATKEEIAQVASISAESEEMGQLVADAVQEVGKDGVITTEKQSNLIGMMKEVVKGMRFEQGYISPYFMTNGATQEAEVKNPYILITDRKISANQEIVPLLDKLLASGKQNIVIIADDVDGEALSTLVVNKMKGILRVVAVKAPEFGDTRRNILEDIAMITGGTLISEETGMKFASMDLSQLGQASRILVTKEETTIVGGKGKKKDIDEKIIELRSAIEKEKSTYFQDKMKKRLARLTGGICVINVGAPTDTELTYMQHKLEDTINATRAAISEGIVAGGGTALVKASSVVSTDSKDPEFRAGYDILVRALSYPLKQIVANVGKQSPDVVCQNVIENGGKYYGYNANLDQYEKDMLKAGIVDPLKVTRSALENAVSVASLLLTTEAALVEEPQKENVNPAQQPPIGQ
jgi:chaperonin GroEL